MRNMSQFIVVVPLSDDTSVTLTSNFMQHGSMKFGISNIVI